MPIPPRAAARARQGHRVAAQPGQPRPNVWVGWHRTVDEMAHAWVNVTYMSDADYRAKSPRAGSSG
jgi:hypothetical protein